jgi:hypothetical protein
MRLPREPTPAMVRRMFRLPCAAVLALVTIAALASCSRKPPEAQAADAARTLLAAAWSDDAKAFDAQVDRGAVRADLRRQLSELAQANALAVEGGASDAALDRMINPAAFRLTDAGGVALTAAPTVEQVRLLVQPQGKDRACLRAALAANTCVLTFGRVGEAWLLVGMAPAGFAIAVPPPAAKDAK